MGSPRNRNTCAPRAKMLLLFFVVHTWTMCGAFHLPGLAPENFCKKSEATSSCKSEVVLYVNRLDTEESPIPYEYHNFDFCRGKGEIPPIENLSQVVLGDRLQPGPYNIQFKDDIECAVACQKNYTGGNADSERRMMLLKKGISQNYQHHWIVNNMPVTWCHQLKTGKQNCNTSFSMGCLVRPDGKGCSINTLYNKVLHYYPFNHVDLEITYHSGAQEDWGMGFGTSGRIISVKVSPRSISHADPNKPNCQGNEPLAIQESSLKTDENLTIVYTYSVKFVQNNKIK